MRKKEKAVRVTEPLDHRLRAYMRRHWPGVQVLAVGLASVPFVAVTAILAAVSESLWSLWLVPACWIPAGFLFMVGLVFGSDAEAAEADRRSERQNLNADI